MDCKNDRSHPCRGCEGWERSANGWFLQAGFHGASGGGSHVGQDGNFTGNLCSFYRDSASEGEIVSAGEKIACS